MIKFGYMITYLYKLPNSKSEIRKSGFDTRVYSLFKYGCAKSTLYFANKIISSVLQINNYNFMDNYISSTLTSGAPSASHWLAKIVTIELNKYAFSKKLASVHYIDLPIATRKHIFKDYSILNYNKREKAQELQTALVSTPKLSSKDKMIIINDTYVTGSQYRKQNEMLTHAGLKEKQMLWFYISRFNGVINKNVNTRLENYINNYAVPDDSSFIKFFETRNSLSEILPNKRLILRILNMSNNKRKIVIDLLETGLKNTLLDYALLENMHLNKRLNYGLEDFK